MDEKSLEILEFPKVKEILAGFTSFLASRQLALDLQPTPDFERVTWLLRQSAEARHLLDIEPSFSMGGVTDIRQEVKMASLGKVLEPKSLLEIGQALAAISQAHHRLEKLSAELPLLWSVAGRLVAFDNIVHDIDSSLEPNGQVADSASAHLAGTRQGLQQQRLHLRERLEAIMKTPRGRKVIQDSFITEREGRYVIPVKIEHQKEMKGIVHDVSNTGATVFIEPFVTMEMGNNLREMIAEERREVERILRSLSAAIGEHEAEISQDIVLMSELDLALAKARYAHKLKAVEPILTDFDDNGKQGVNTPSGVIKLVEARHPLLGDKAVPLSVEIGRDFSTLVITGPNTGGKTVAIKTIGLLSLMTQCGIPIPASADSRIPLFDSIFADIGDEQSIAQTLSTFSWHVSNMVRIINHATRKSLVLLDELGTSTDPVEGSALAVAVLRHFLLRRTMTVATTHFSEVKAFAHGTPGMQNASFDVDPKTLIPTYHLTIGIPSGSNALAIGRRLGLPPEIIAEAERLIPEGMREVEGLLTSLRNKEAEITVLHRQLEKEKEEAEQRKREFEAEQRRSKAELSDMIREARDRVTLEVAELTKQIREAAIELRREKSKERLEQTRKAIAAIREQVQSKILSATGDEEIAEQASETSRIAVGDTVSIKEAGVKATVLSVSEERQEAEVQAGQTKLRLGLDKIEKTMSPGGQAVSRATPVVVKMAPRPVSRELDLRGKRADEVQPLLDRYLNDASLASQMEVRIIHGYGTGTVRQIVRESLETHPLVKSFRPGKKDEGGDGVTIVQF